MSDFSECVIVIEQIADAVVQLVGEQEQHWTSSKLTLRAQGSDKVVEKTMDYPAPHDRVRIRSWEPRAAS